MIVKLAASAHFPTEIRFPDKKHTATIVDFKGETGETAVRYEKSSTIIYCGLGDAQVCTPGILRTAAAKGLQRAAELKREKVAIVAPAESLCGKSGILASIEGALLGAYTFSQYKSEKPFSVEQLEIVSKEINAAQLKETETLSGCVCYARDLVNANASEIFPERLAREAQDIAQKSGMRVTILDEKQLRKEGLGLIDAVGRGSETPPRLIIIEYNGSKSREKTAIVGKGITFDSGGQNLKPTGHIETMRSDMAGAAAVLGTMKAIAALKPSINVVGVVVAAHNAIGKKAFFPGDIYKSYEGQTVEICSTDAEGRLVLADAVAYCRKKQKPSRIVDLATLTGGVLYALGDLVAGLFSNNDKLAEALFDAGENTGERVWRFPLYKEYSDSLKSDFADLRNLSKFKKGYASSITGAAFIQEFVKELPWAHIDIAGTAFNEGAWRGEVSPFATGFGVRLLWRFLKKS